LEPLNQEKKHCFSLEANEKSSCTEELKEKVEHLAIFHMYELNVQAETLLSQGRVGKQEVANLELFVETKKEEFEKAATLQEWKEIIEETKLRWQEFIGKIQIL